MKKSILLTSIVITILMVSALSVLMISTVRATSDWHTELYGWDTVANAYTNGNLAGYNEGDIVAFKYVLTNNQAITAQVPALESFYDYFNTNKNCLGIDKEILWQKSNSDFSARFPSGLTTVTPDTSNVLFGVTGGVQQNKYDFNAGTLGNLASGQSLYLYFQGHVSETAYWQTQLSAIQGVAGPHNGASFFPGASMQVGLDTPYSGAQTQTQSIPINLAPGSISGLKFNDLNGNGNKDTGDNGLQGWTINLQGTDLVGNTFTLTTQTAADGTYSFIGLPQGTYVISETPQLGWTQTAPASHTYSITIDETHVTITGKDFGNTMRINQVPEPSVAALILTASIATVIFMMFKRNQQNKLPTF